MTIHLGLAYDDGRLGVMQYIGEDDDAAIQETIQKLADRPAGWKRITPEEAAAIRANRPEPDPVPVSVTEVPTVNIAEIQVVQQENAELKHRLAMLEHQFSAFATGLSEAIAKHKQDAAE